MKKMANIQMFSVENDGINCSILSSNEMHIFFPRPTYVQCTHTPHRTERNLFARAGFSPIYLLANQWNAARENFLKTFSTTTTTRENELECGREGNAVAHFNAHACKHIKRTSNCRRRFQVAGCENNCLIFLMQHIHSHTVARTQTRWDMLTTFVLHLCVSGLCVCVHAVASYYSDIAVIFRWSLFCQWNVLLADNDRIRALQIYTKCP